MASRTKSAVGTDAPITVGVSEIINGQSNNSRRVNEERTLERKTRWMSSYMYIRYIPAAHPFCLPRFLIGFSRDVERRHIL